MMEFMDERRPSLTELITPRDLQEAEASIGVTCLRTPVLPVSHPAGGKPVWVKAESLQRTGSFKLRGATNALATLSETESASGVVTFSAGNHGRALAYAAQIAGVRATVVMPETAAPVKINGTRALGATVVLRPPDEIVAYANHLAAVRGLTSCRPSTTPGSSLVKARSGWSCSARSTTWMWWWCR
jgi:threonine dehydratase